MVKIPLYTACSSEKNYIFFYWTEQLTYYSTEARARGCTKMCNYATQKVKIFLWRRPLLILHPIEFNWWQADLKFSVKAHRRLNAPLDTSEIASFNDMQICKTCGRETFCLFTRCQSISRLKSSAQTWIILRKSRKIQVVPERLLSETTLDYFFTKPISSTSISHLN